MVSSPRPRIRRLGVVVAMDEEFARISRRLENVEVVHVGPREFLCAQLFDVNVVCVRCRIGKVAAASTVTTLINRFEVDAVVFTGVAGGVASHVRIGDLVVAQNLMQHDIDLKGVLGCHRFDIPLLGMARMPATSELLDIAALSARSVVDSAEYLSSIKKFSPHAPQAINGTIASGDTFICSAREREVLVRGIPDLLCVEMEGGAVSQVCLEYGVPYVGCRIISDAADVDAPLDFGAFLVSAAAVGSELFVSAFVSRLSQSSFID
jgi:adenosylhomocysteine nucleosidase